VCGRALLWHPDTSIFEHDLSAVLWKQLQGPLSEEIIGRKTMIRISDFAIGMLAYAINEIHFFFP
jgi:hypothetical protein